MSGQKNYLVTGANRGLGLEFTNQILQSGHYVYAACRNIMDVDELNLLSDEYKNKLIIVDLDINDQDKKFLQRIADEATSDYYNKILN